MAPGPLSPAVDVFMIIGGLPVDPLAVGIAALLCLAC